MLRKTNANERVLTHHALTWRTLLLMYVSDVESGPYSKAVLIAISRHRHFVPKAAIGKVDDQLVVGWLLHE